MRWIMWGATAVIIIATAFGAWITYGILQYDAKIVLSSPKDSQPSISPLVLTATVMTANHKQPTGTVTLNLLRNAQSGTNKANGSAQRKLDDGIGLLTKPLEEGGNKVVFEFPTLAIGDYAFSASYSGDIFFHKSTSLPLLQSSEPALSALTLTAALNPHGPPDTYLVTTILTSQSPVLDKDTEPTGTVTIKKEGSPQEGNIVTSIEVRRGEKTTTTITLDPGPHFLFAVFPGNDLFEAAATGRGALQIGGPWGPIGSRARISNRP